MAEQPLTKAEGEWRQHGDASITLQTERLKDGTVRLYVMGVECEEIILDKQQGFSLAKWLLWEGR